MTSRCLLEQILEGLQQNAKVKRIENRDGHLRGKVQTGQRGLIFTGPLCYLLTYCKQEADLVHGPPTSQAQCVPVGHTIGIVCPCGAHYETSFSTCIANLEINQLINEMFKQNSSVEYVTFGQHYQLHFTMQCHKLFKKLKLIFCS